MLRLAVQISSLWGLWVILSVAICVAAIAGLVDYELKRRRGSEKVAQIQEHATVFKRALAKSVSFAPRGGSMRGSQLGVESSKSSMDENDARMVRSSLGSFRDSPPMGSMHDGIVPAVCLEVVTESHEETSPKSSMLKHGGSHMDSHRASANGSARGEFDDGGHVSARRRSQVRAEVAASAALAAVAAEEAEEARAEAAATEKVGDVSVQRRSQARSEAAAIAAEEATARQAAAASARSSSDHPTARSVSASLGLVPHSALDTSSPARTGNAPDCFIPADITDSPPVRHNISLPPPLPVRNLLPHNQHSFGRNTMQQRSFGRTVSSASSRGHNVTTLDADGNSSLLNNQLVRYSPHVT